MAWVAAWAVVVLVLAQAAPELVLVPAADRSRI